MNRYTKIFGILVAAAVVAGGVNWYQSAYADVQQTTPGLADDPIVTKSYVDQKIAELSNGGPTGANSGKDTASESKLEVVTVPFGAKLMVGAGGEVVVRTGKAVAYSVDTNGLSDLTAGIDIAPGMAIATNHLILFPRDGRGIEPDPKQKNGLTVLVRGKYNLV
ncbi:hypothetical protein SAMN05216312_109150 [Cohnella sp. OV330]|uniref:hypothetical protein n=1 Tax=Cohnella sp. OV330 TaxID=1855288 RepID=UPI0008E78980|nr:hypothetical protein [Cohnella sp. OV330]SFB47426.1 hypothetical protein SAMN05216312_109150 [Cohnella sp. OV330]